jgi:CheY-like chemotaxis protein
MKFGRNRSNLNKVNSVSLVDDDVVSNLITSNTIQKTGFAKKVNAFDNAKDALSEIVRLSYNSPNDLPELIFLDISMPVMDGLEFLDEFDKLTIPIPEKCKVFMLSSSVNPNEIQKVKNHNKVCDFISKPLTASKLQTIFSQWGYA